MYNKKLCRFVTQTNTIMDNKILNLQPERVWYYFNEICKIPRSSKHEEKIAKYLILFGKEHALETVKDEVGNILIKKPAAAGMEKRQTVVLQSHIDMICEKNNDVVHDFDFDPIVPVIENEWVKARGTTLGADDGIGIATQLAILESTTIVHGPIECLFTIDEETGLTGAKGIMPGFLKGTILLNLDSEDEGQIFIGCAGGKDTIASLPYSKIPVPIDVVAFQLSISGLKGGHSGDDINKRLGNANKIMNRLLWNANQKYELRISRFDGGNLRNSIAREATAIVTVPKRFQNQFQEYVIDFEAIIINELEINEPNLVIACKQTVLPDSLIDMATQEKLLNAIYGCPHGVIAMSATIANFVETSTNLATVKTLDNKFEIATSQRSSVESAKEDISTMVASIFRLAGCKVIHSDGYPGWNPNPQSPVLDLAVSSYQQLFHQKPLVLAVHAGLECGIIGEKNPGMDMISFGPTIKGAHSPDEKLEIATVKRFWDFTLDILKKIPE